MSTSGRPRLGPRSEDLDRGEHLFHRPVIERVEPSLDEPDVYAPHSSSLDLAGSTGKPPKLGNVLAYVVEHVHLMCETVELFLPTSFPLPAG